MENKSKLSWNSFEQKLGSWGSKFYPFYLEGKFDPIFEFLKKESRRGKRIAPNSENTFRAFYECEYDNLRLIVIGQSPYHLLKDNQPIADGLAFSCGITKYPQPSLDQLFSALENEMNNGLCLPCIKNPDLTYLANKEGVLLLNAALTTSIGKPGDHLALWEPFMKYLFENVLQNTTVPIVLLGRDAQKLEKYINPFTNIFKLSHPASASYSGDIWSSEGVFKQINTILKHRNGEVINWFDESDVAPF